MLSGGFVKPSDAFGTLSEVLLDLPADLFSRGVPGEFPGLVLFSRGGRLFSRGVPGARFIFPGRPRGGFISPGSPRGGFVTGWRRFVKGS